MLCYYASVSDRGDISSQEQADTEESSIRISILRASQSKAVFGQVIPKKGVDNKGFAANAIVEDVNWLGGHEDHAQDRQEASDP